MRISDWSSDVCSSDLLHHELRDARRLSHPDRGSEDQYVGGEDFFANRGPFVAPALVRFDAPFDVVRGDSNRIGDRTALLLEMIGEHGEHRVGRAFAPAGRSEEHTSELQSLMRTSYAVFCLKTQ